MFLLKTATNIFTYTVFPLGSTKSIYILLGQLLQFFIYRTYLSRQYYNFFFNWISLLQIRITSQEFLDLFHS